MVSRLKTFLAGLRPRPLFLADGLGAMLSALVLAGFIAPNSTAAGMPRPVLYGLAIIALVLSVYSLSCYAINPGQWKTRLRIIALANLGYACGSAAFVFYFYAALHPWCLLYFVAEVKVILALAFLEWRMQRNLDIALLPPTQPRS